MSTPAALSHCPQNVLCMCVSVTPALPCQNATCSSRLQLNGKLEILTIDLVVQKLVKMCSREELVTSPFHHPERTHIYLTGLPIKPQPPSSPHLLFVRFKATLRSSGKTATHTHKSQASKSIKEQSREVLS